MKYETMVSCFSFMLTNVLSAQELTLFEETELNRANLTEAREEIRRDRDGNRISDIYFKLVGTSRIGDSYVVTIEDQSSEVITLSSELEPDLPIPGNSGYFLVEVGSGKVSIRYPQGSPCKEHLDEGVKCTSTSLASVTLTNGSPIASSPSLSGALQTLGEDTDSELINPFEAILERQINPNSETDEAAFTPRRINPEDVPPGMKVVSTPFGDRLVEED